ncbi:helix-turn-helix transcriptional regulator, partial [Cellulomonas iranensis]|uniref:helix-turn-helix transcriptional regulator n=1 Tax=Cellulomonas iranensis TaxID=76862 RepID=UPI001C4F1B47
DDARAAHDALERALTLAATDGVVRPLRDRAPAVRPLLVAHLGRGSAHEDLVTRLLTTERPGGAPRPSALGLTERERDVLACLPSRMTVEEIGAALFVSPNTVKTHVRSVYHKLGVTSRRDAVRTAVERGLL